MALKVVSMRLERIKLLDMYALVLDQQKLLVTVSTSFEMERNETVHNIEGGLHMAVVFLLAGTEQSSFL